MKDRKAVARFGSRSAVRLADLAQLVRAPAALSVPGDVIAGAAAAGRPLGVRTLGVIGSSVCLYWAGMALNDYADATVDAVERPERPVPSGRVPRRAALAVAGGLTAAGLGLAAAAGGRRSLLGAVPLAGLVWAYDLGLKNTPAGAVAMAGARTLDVLAGALVPGPGAVSVGEALRRAAVPAALTGVHTGTLMALSRHEIAGAPARVPATTLAVSATTALATAIPVKRVAVGSAGTCRRASAAPSWLVAPRGGAADRHSPAPLEGVAATAPSSKLRTAVTATAALAYLGTYGTAQARAVQEPSGENVRRAVGAGILGLMPLQAALTARGGAPAVAAALAIVHPLARRLARRISPT
ncbi:SCO3242 family prenyltransferase [Streptomyces sp. NPDC051243]|uniref:SCO3242 family prenyltransferase n=1 Tax=Streptomyces sp. NPDC051243 TaxID=3365646 RepID=UPI0037A45564